MGITDENFIKTILKSIEGHDDLTITKKDLNKNVVPTGNNYCSEIVQLNVEYTTESGEQKTQNFIIKIFSTTPVYEIGKSMGIYEREIEMYKTVLPEMSKLINQSKEELIFPKIFDTNNPDIMVFEDLKSSGYVMMDRVKQLDFEHASVALKTLAKFHALSIKLNEKSPNIIEKVSDDVFFTSETSNKMFTDIYEISFKSVLAELEKIEKAQKFINSFVDLKFEILNKVKELLTLKKNKIKLLNHGDHWLNNLMFRHDSDGNVIDNKLLDFQICRWVSPAIDIWYFLVTSVEFSVFELHFDSLIAIYVTSLNENLENIGTKVKYDFKEISEELDESVAFGIFIMFTTLNGVLSDPSDPVDMTELLENPGSFNLDALAKTYGNENYLKVLVKWFLYFNERIEKDGIKFFT